MIKSTGVLEWMIVKIVCFDCNVQIKTWSPGFPDSLYKLFLWRYTGPALTNALGGVQMTKAAYPMGDISKQDLQVDFDGRLMLDFHGAKIKSDEPAPVNLMAAASNTATGNASFSGRTPARAESQNRPR